MMKNRLGTSVLVALAIQAATTLVWAGAAAERILVLERHMAENRPVAERLARLEARLDAVHAHLNRIEEKVDQL